MTECYCVCHTPVSSNAYCEHCLGDNEVGRFHIDQAAHELTPEEGRRLFDKLCQERLGVSGATFASLYYAGADYPAHWEHDNIIAVEICMPFWGRP